MGRILLLGERIRDAVIMSLGGFTSEQMEQVIKDANQIGDLAKKGKYPGVVESFNVFVKVRKLRELTSKLFPEFAERQGYVFLRRKRGVQTMEVIHRERERTIPTIACEIVNETLPCGVLESNTGFAERSRVDLQ